MYNIVSCNRKQIDINLAIPTIILGGITFQDMTYMEKHSHRGVIYLDCHPYKGKHNFRFTGDCGNRQALLEICSEWMGYPSPGSLKGAAILLMDEVGMSPSTSPHNYIKYKHDLITPLPPPHTCGRDTTFDFRKKYNIDFDLI